MSTALRRGLAPAATMAAVAGVLVAVYKPWFLNYDARYALLWARDFWTGHSPEYTADFAPTPHPLQMAFSSLALPFGEAADDLLTIAILLCFGAVVYLIYRIGADLFHPAVGVVAALTVFTRPTMERDAVLAYQDIPFAALVIAALLLEARRPRRGLPVLALLAVAGLLRPEAWLLSGLYVLYMWPATTRAQWLRLAALAATAPLLWALSDLLVTGDLLHSLHGTADLAEAVDRRRDVADVPYWTVQYLGAALREPLVVGGPLGLLFAWLYRRDRTALLPLAVVAAMLLVFAVGPLFGLPLIARYVRTPAAILSLFYGLAVAGWLLLARDTLERRIWIGVGALALLASLVFVPKHLDMLRSLDRRVGQQSRLYEALRDVGRDPRVRASVASCGPMSTADHRPIPYVRWWLNAPPGRVGTIRAGASPLGATLLTPKRTRLTLRVFAENFPPERPPPGWPVLYENQVWRLNASPECLTRLRP